MDIKAISPILPISSTPTDAVSSKEDSGNSFASFLNDALSQVNDLQQQSDTASEQLATGQIDDISQVMIAAEKANISLQLTTQIRNKVVDAYQEIMRMQL